MGRLTEEVRQLFRYGAVGAVNTIVFYLVYLLLLALDVAPTVAAGIVYVLGVVFSYALNRRWTFDSKGSHRRDAPKYVGAYGIGFLSTLITISVMLRWLSPELAQIVNIVVTPVVIYTSLRLLRFGEENPQNAT